MGHFLLCFPLNGKNHNLVRYPLENGTQQHHNNSTFLKELKFADTLEILNLKLLIKK